jgi:uncharacterized phiE125 gp8 family phage protein
MISWEFSFDDTPAAPPAQKELRFDAAAPYIAVTKVWLRNLTNDGVDIHNLALLTPVGSTVYVQDENDHTAFVVFMTTGPAIDQITYVELPVEWVRNGNPLARNQIVQFVASGPAPAPEPPPTVPSTGIYPFALPGPWSPVGGHWSVSTVTPPNEDDVLTVAQLKERARILPGDEESDELYQSYIAAARMQVERDTGFALSTRTLAVGYDRLDLGAYQIPYPPCQDVTSVIYMDVEGGSTDLGPEVIAQLDRVSMPARVTFLSGAFAGLAAPSSMQPLGLVITAGFAQGETPDAFRFLVGLLASHYVTAGRDRVALGGDRMDVMPAGYTELVNALRLETLV